MSEPISTSAGTSRRPLSSFSISQDSVEVFTQCSDLLFLELERHGASSIAGLNEKGSSAWFAKGARNNSVRIHELPRLAHESPNFDRSSPVEFTVRTAGPPDE